MPDYSAAYDFEGQIQSAFANLFVNGNVPVEIAQGAVTHAAPCVSVAYAHAGDYGDVLAPFPDGEWRPKCFSGVLLIDIVTNKSDPDEGGITQGLLRGKLRFLLTPLCLKGKEKLSALQAEMTCLEIFHFKEAGSQQSINKANEDVTTLRFDIRFAFDLKSDFFLNPPN